MPDEQEEAVGGHGGGGEQERQQAGRVAKAERERAADPQLKVISRSKIQIGTTFYSNFILNFILNFLAGTIALTATVQHNCSSKLDPHVRVFS